MRNKLSDFKNRLCGLLMSFVQMILKYSRTVPPASELQSIKVSKVNIGGLCIPLFCPLPLPKNKSYKCNKWHLPVLMAIVVVTF